MSGAANPRHGTKPSAVPARQIAPWAPRPAGPKRRSGRRGNLISGGVGDLVKLANLARWQGPIHDPAPSDQARPRRAAMTPSLAFLELNPLAIGPVGQLAGQVASEPEALPLQLGDRAAIVVANHSTGGDLALLLSRLPAARRRRTVLVCAKGDTVPPTLRVRFPVARLNFDVPGAAGARLVRSLRRGWSAIVFAEGVPSRDGALGAFSDFPAELARRAGVPLVPVAIRGAFAAENSRPARRSGRGRIAVRFGVPMDSPSQGPDVAEVTGQIRRAVQSLLAEDATSWWQARRRATNGVPSTSTSSSSAPLTPSRSSLPNGGPVQGVYRGGNDAPDPDQELWRRVWEHTASPTVGGADDGHRIWR